MRRHYIGGVNMKKRILKKVVAMSIAATIGITLMACCNKKDADVVDTIKSNKKLITQSELQIFDNRFSMLLDLYRKAIDNYGTHEDNSTPKGRACFEKRLNDFKNNIDNKHFVVKGGYYDITNFIYFCLIPKIKVCIALRQNAPLCCKSISQKQAFNYKTEE